MKNEWGIKEAEIFVESDEDIILTRQKVRILTQQMGFSTLSQTRIVTAVSELARNIVVHAKEGRVSIYTLENRRGLRIVFEDQGPGIPDLEKAMEGGYSTVGSLGLGLKGAQRLVDEFEIKTEPGQGTRVTITSHL